MQKLLDAINITTNKNSLVGDSPQTPYGIRLGTPAVTTRGMNQEDMERIADWLLKAVDIAKRLQDKSGKKLKDFLIAMAEDPELPVLQKEIEAFASSFDMP